MVTKEIHLSSRNFADLNK